MSSLNRRRYGEPILVDPNGVPVARPRRIDLTQKKIEERWLQDLIRRCPEILPAAEIEPAFTPLVAVGMEVPTPVGPIDNLYLSPRGYVTIAETKLWRNPEARREVVGQIIDYAKELCSWSYDDLENQVRNYNRLYRDSELGLFETLGQYEQIDRSEEAGIVDTVSRNLETGRFLLLVVGDGIRESVEAMAEFLASTPRLHFTLALVELELYDMSDSMDGRLLIIPHVVAKTKEITRAVVRVEGEAKSIQIAIDTQPETGGRIRRSATLTEEDYFSQLGQRADPEDASFARYVIGDMEARGCVVEWKAASFVIKLPDLGESGALLTLLVVPTDGKAYVGWLRDQLRSLGIPQDIAVEYVRMSAALLGVNVSPKDASAWRSAVPLSQLHAKYDEFTDVVQSTIDRIKAASYQTHKETSS